MIRIKQTTRKFIDGFASKKYDKKLRQMTTRKTKKAIKTTTITKTAKEDTFRIIETIKKRKFIYRFNQMHFINNIENSTTKQIKK